MSDRLDRVYDAGGKVFVSVEGTWKPAELVGGGTDADGVWFWTNDFRPKFYVRDEGVTWRAA